MQDRGFFASLFDINFNSLITPKLIKVLYVLFMIVIAIGAVIFIIGAFMDSTGFGIVTLVILAPLGALLYLIFARVMLELTIVIFKIRDAADQIAEGSSRPGPASAPPTAPSEPRA